MRAPLRIGVLGAASIATVALLRPARRLPAVEVVAVAARDPERAARFAVVHGIPCVHASYGALVADPQIDAVYVPLPNSLHAVWSMRALEAGKHVLCEKPLAANGDEAALVAKAAAACGLIVMEAFHPRYHPLMARLKTIIGAGEIGDIRHIEAEFSVPLLDPRSIQYRYALGGGATMDVGCYAINLIRALKGDEPEVVRARASRLLPQIDRRMVADFSFRDGATARMTCALLSVRLLHMSAHVRGTAGTIHIASPFLPHLYNHIIVRGRQGDRHEHIEGLPTYDYQLHAFAAAVASGIPPLTSGTDGVANMRVVDAIYRAAGLRPRGMGTSGPT